MKITCNHSASSYGLPVILDDKGKVMNYSGGVRSLREEKGLSARQLGDLCGVSARTVEGWAQGRTPSAAALNIMAGILEKGGGDE